MRVIFMGSPDFAVPTLDALLDDPEFEVLQVVTQPDRPKGRGKKLTPTPVKQRALDAGVPAVAMTKRDYKDVAAALSALEPDFVVVAAFGVILRNDILDLPRLGCVNLHASLLPKYRGVSPVQAAILSGDEETGCTTMLMDAGVDTGDMLLGERVRIEPGDTAGSLEDKLAKLGAPLMIKTLKGLRDGSVEPRKQDDDQASYTKKIKKDHGLIRWEERAAAIARQIRAMSPWPTAHTSFGDKRLIILSGREQVIAPDKAGREQVIAPDKAGREQVIAPDKAAREDHSAAPPAGRASPGIRPPAEPPPGTVVSTSPFVVAAGEGTLEISEVKVAGKKEMPAAAFVAGYRVSVGDRLG